MTILEPEFKHTDSRRSITQLFTSNIAQVNVYDAKKGAVLGNHYHKETIEFFYIVRGSLIANDKVLSKGSLFVVYPEEPHTIECLTDVSLMTFLSKPFDLENPDLWKK